MNLWYRLDRFIKEMLRPPVTRAQLIRHAATKSVDGEGFRKRMEAWLCLHKKR